MKKTDGSRAICDSGLCCGKSWIKNDELSELTPNEICYKERITMFQETECGKNGATDKK